MSVTVLEALKALKAMAEGPDKVTLAQFIAERRVAEAPKENTGLPCRLCGQNQARVDLAREEEETSVRIAWLVNPEEMDHLIELLKALHPRRA